MTRVRSVRSCDAVTETERGASLGGYGAARRPEPRRCRRSATPAIDRPRGASVDVDGHLRERRPPPRARLGRGARSGPGARRPGRATRARPCRRRRRREAPAPSAAPRSAPRSRLAGRATSGTDPNTGRSTGATPICAASVTPRAPRSQRGPGRRAVMRRGEHRDAGAGAAREQEADRVEEERVGEQRAPATARASTRSAGRGTTEVQRGHRARRHRARPQHRRLPARHRPEQHERRRDRRRSWPRSADRRSSGPASASTNATLAPDTASRCVSPTARNCSSTSRGSSRVSPSRKPATRARSVGGRWSPPAQDAGTKRVGDPVQRRPRAGSNASELDRVEAAPPRAATAAARRSRRAAGASPTAATSSPDSRSRSRPAVSPPAVTSTVRGLRRDAPSIAIATRTRTRAV